MMGDWVFRLVKQVVREERKIYDGYEVTNIAGWI